jgi:hypothetical protein
MPTGLSQMWYIGIIIIIIIIIILLICVFYFFSLVVLCNWLWIINYYYCYYYYYYYCVAFVFILCLSLMQLPISTLCCVCNWPCSCWIGPLIIQNWIELNWIIYWRCDPMCVLASSMVLLLRLWTFRNSRFLQGGDVSPTQNPQPGGPGTTLCWTPTLWAVWHGWPYQELTLPPAQLSGSLLLFKMYIIHCPISLSVCNCLGVSHRVVCISYVIWTALCVIFHTSRASVPSLGLRFDACL